MRGIKLQNLWFGKHKKKTETFTNVGWTLNIVDYPSNICSFFAVKTLQGRLYVFIKEIWGTITTWHFLLNKSKHQIALKRWDAIMRTRCNRRSLWHLGRDCNWERNIGNYSREWMRRLPRIRFHCFETAVDPRGPWVHRHRSRGFCTSIEFRWGTCYHRWGFGRYTGYCNCQFWNMQMVLLLCLLNLHFARIPTIKRNVNR